MEQIDSTTELEQRIARRRLRRRLVFAGVAVLLLAALILTPPLINVNRYRRRIVTTMSQSLGRPVHLDGVTLHFLPIPGLTLKNLVVSEDPAFGYEPVIRANKVEATLRASSLWRRQIEFSTIRFEADENGSGPSVNLVRNSQGHWNLEEILMQAAHVDIAPTAQRHPGPTPRFPYIEATDARVNVKLGDEKMPYSLTDAEFALWLPSPKQWRLRLDGKPSRTDNNVSEAGTLRVEGSLQQGASIADLPVDLQASWRGAPLGEASRLLSGNDAGWRGTLFLETAMTGTLSKVAVTTHLQLNDLRRSDFVPAKSLDVTINCSARSNVLDASLSEAQCAVPIDDKKPLTLTSDTVDMRRPEASSAKAQIQALPVDWALGWAKLFSPLVPAGLTPKGVLDGDLDWNATARSWQGRLIATLPNKAEEKSPRGIDAPDTDTVLTFDVDSTSAWNHKSTSPWLRLEPAPLRITPPSALTLSGQADSDGYNLQLSGTGTITQVHALAAKFPPFQEGLDELLPVTTEHSDTPRTITLSCTRPWGEPQTCEALAPPVPARPQRPRRRRR